MRLLITLIPLFWIRVFVLFYPLIFLKPCYVENVHSVINKGGQNWTGSYWDEFASLPPIIPNGPVAIYGLGGGTAARLMLELWPTMQLEGWEIDEIVLVD